MGTWMQMRASGVQALLRNNATCLPMSEVASESYAALFADAGVAVSCKLLACRAGRKLLPGKSPAQSVAGFQNLSVTDAANWQPGARGETRETRLDPWQRKRNPPTFLVRVSHNDCRVIRCRNYRHPPLTRAESSWARISCTRYTSQRSRTSPKGAVGIDHIQEGCYENFFDFPQSAGLTIR